MRPHDRGHHLFETGDLDVENARLVLEASVRTEEFDGRVYLEMLVSLPGRGEFFSRAIHAALSGTTLWTTQQAPFVLQPGENPDNVKVNLVVEGRGAVRVDRVRLLRGPLI